MPKANPRRLTPRRPRLAALSRSSGTEDDQSLPALIGKGKIDKTQRLVSELPSWLEAWNKFVAIRVQTFPDTALAMLQYQSTICQLFSTFGPVAALKYDKLFRQAVARAKDQTVRWDNLKEDLLVWQASATLVPGRSAGRAYPSLIKVPQLLQEVLVPATPPTMVESQLTRRCAAVSMLEGATGQTALTSTSAPSQAAERLTLPTLVPTPLRWPHELQRARTPLRGSAFELELSHHPDKAWVSRLLIGINNGVSTGYKDTHYHFQARNLASALAHPEVVDAELKKEVDSCRVLGPFPSCLLHNFRTPGLGVVLKKNGKWRMILHLSAPEGHSINDYISKDEFSLHYSTIDDAVALLGKFQRGALMAKLDLQAAYHMVPQTSSMSIASALHWILEHNYGATLLHYLDDFLLLLHVCQKLGMPVTREKSEGPATSLTFLGIGMDSSLQQLWLPPAKLQEIAAIIKCWLEKTDRLFLWRLIHLSTTVRRLHHRIHLNTDARADIEWWDHFLPSWNGIAMFIAPEWKDAEAIHLFTDASGTFGFGVFFNGAWIRGDWQPHQQLPGRSIQWQELFDIIAAVLTWAWVNQSSKQPGINELLRLLFLTAAQYSFTVSLVHLPGWLNCIADAQSRGQQSHLQHESSHPGNTTLAGPSPPSAEATTTYLVQMLGLLDSDHLQTHDRLMVKAALTIGFLRVSEFTTPGRGKFNPRTHPTRQEITRSENSLLFLIKKSKTDQAGRGTTISVGSTGGATCPVSAMEVYLNHSQESHQTALFHFQTGRPLSSRAMRSILRDLLHRLGHDSSPHTACGLEQPLQQHRQDFHPPPFNDWDVGAVQHSLLIPDML
eukprot:Em0001g990a